MEGDVLVFCFSFSSTSTLVACGSGSAMLCNKVLSSDKLCFVPLFQSPSIVIETRILYRNLTSRCKVPF